MRSHLRQKLSYARFWQLAFVFTCGISLYLFSTIPYGWWIFMTVMGMSAAVEPGLIVKNSINQGKGTILGILLFIPLVSIMYLNYRVIPILLIFCGIGISLPNERNYYIRVVFLTLMLFTITAYNSTQDTLESPIEIVINRAVCTIIGILICICGDYFLFGRYKYSHKVYFLLQHEICNILETKMDKICAMNEDNKNVYLLANDLRESFNKIYKNLVTCGTSISNSLTDSKIIKKKVIKFEEILWELRKIVFATYYSNCILKDKNATREHLAQFKQLMNVAKNNMIALND